MYLKRLRELREDKDLKQVNIANILQMKQPQYARYEIGERNIPLEHLIKLCLFYNVSADYILGLPADLPYPKR